MSMTKRQFRELLRGSIKTRKAFERQAIAENLKEEGYEPLEEDDFTDAETADEDAMGGETVFQPTTLPEGNGWDDYAPDDDSGARHQQDNYTIGPYGDQVASRKPKLFQRKSTVPIHMDVVKGGREDALAGLPMNTRYKLQPKYIAAYEKALAAKDEPMSRKSLEEGCGDMPMAEPEMEDEEFSFTGDVGELSGDEAFAVGWAAALEQARTTIEGLLDGVGGAGGETEMDHSSPCGGCGDNLDEIEAYGTDRDSQTALSSDKFNLVDNVYDQLVAADIAFEDWSSDDQDWLDIGELVDDARVPVDNFKDILTKYAAGHGVEVRLS